MNINSLNNGQNIDQNSTYQIKQDKKLNKACKDFEAILLTNLLKAMRKTVSESSLFGKSLQKDIFNSLYDEKLAENLSQGRGVGIAEVMYKQIKKTY